MRNFGAAVGYAAYIVKLKRYGLYDEACNMTQDLAGHFCNVSGEMRCRPWQTQQGDTRYENVLTIRKAVVIIRLK